ncbi:hypothetical protein ACVBEF_17470 [Glaciimonas sp. GG7]
MNTSPSVSSVPVLSQPSYSTFEAEMEPRAAEYEANFKALPDTIKLAPNFVVDGVEAVISSDWLRQELVGLPEEAVLQVHRIACEFQGTTNSARNVKVDTLFTPSDGRYGFGKFALPRSVDSKPCCVRYGYNDNAAEGVMQVTSLYFQSAHQKYSLMYKSPVERDPSRVPLSLFQGQPL